MILEADPGLRVNAGGRKCFLAGRALQDAFGGGGGGEAPGQWGKHGLMGCVFFWGK